MRFEFTQHARDRCRERGIRYRDVQTTVSNPTKTRVTASGTIEATGKIRNKTLIVIFETQKEIRVIITAYYEDQLRQTC